MYSRESMNGTYNVTYAGRILDYIEFILQLCDFE